MAVEASQQTVCPHCEEMVHRYAARCPYCQHDLASPVLPQIFAQNNVQGIIPNVSSNGESDPNPKITQVPFHDHFETDAAEESASLHTKKGVIQELLPLVALLSGSFFFFFGMLIRFFSTNGNLTLQWSQSSWPYFIFPSGCALIAGVILLSKMRIQDDTEE